MTSRENDLLVLLFSLHVSEALEATIPYRFTLASLTRAYSCKRPALVMTTFSNARGGRLRELQLYLNLAPHDLHEMT